MAVMGHIVSRVHSTGDCSHPGLLAWKMKYGRDYGDPSTHDGVLTWKHFPHYWPFVRGIHCLLGYWWNSLQKSTTGSPFLESNFPSAQPQMVKDSLVWTMVSPRDSLVWTMVSPRDSLVWTMVSPRDSLVWTMVSPRDSLVWTMVSPRDSLVWTMVSPRDSLVWTMVSPRDSLVWTMVSPRDSHWGKSTKITVWQFISMLSQLCRRLKAICFRYCILYTNLRRLNVLCHMDIFQACYCL